MDLTNLKNSVERIGTTLDPDDDWVPVLLLEKQDHVIVFGLLMMQNDETKDMCAKLMTKLIMETNPETATFVSTAWSSKHNKEEVEESFKERYRKGLIPRPSEDPNRIEVVCCVTVNQLGEDTMLLGEIERSDTHPKIKKWDEMDSDAGSGRFIEAMRKGFGHNERKEEYGRAKTENRARSF